MDLSPAQVALGKASLERNSKEGEDGHRWWTGATRGILGEYGRLQFQGRYMASHRLAYQLHMGIPEIEKGLHVRHLCGKTLCVEPTHLTLGTASENEIDKVRHGTSLHGKNAKISVETARAIKNSKGEGMIQDRADRFDVSVAIVSRIDTRRSWAWVGKHPRDDNKNMTSKREKMRKICNPLTEKQQQRAQTYICERATNPRKGTVCAIWKNQVGKDGYGVATFKNRWYAAHRLSYCAFNNIGSIPEGKIVRHKCINKACVSPWCLELGDR